MGEEKEKERRDKNDWRNTKGKWVRGRANGEGKEKWRGG